MNLRLAVCALALIGLCRSIWVHALVEPRTPRGPRSDSRYASARPYFANVAEAGYLSDQPVDLAPGELAHLDSTRLYQQALYALSPLVLRYGDDRAALVLVNVQDPARLEAVLGEHRLKLVARAGPGLAVARP